MKSMVITPKNQTEFKFISELLNKLGLSATSLNEEELEDLGLSKMMKGLDKSKKTSRASVMKKLRD